MSVKTNSNDAEEQTNDWHPLPMLIGGAITKEDTEYQACGNYLVIREDDDTIRVYREIAMAESVEELETEGDRMWEFPDDYVTGNEFLFELTPPEGGWDSETSSVSADIFGGYR